MADSRAGVGARGPPADGPDSLLLVARRSDVGARAYCRSHLAGGSAGRRRPLVVLTDRASDEGPAARFGDDQPGLVVAVGGSTRSSTTADDPPATPTARPETVVATGDLGSVGATVDHYLSTWAAAGHRPSICVDSLAGLVDHASVQESYRFLFVLLRRIGRSNGAIHAHAESHVHEEEILRTFYPLFDRVVSFRNRGSVRP